MCGGREFSAEGSAPIVLSLNDGTVNIAVLKEQSVQGGV